MYSIEEIIIKAKELHKLLLGHDYSIEFQKTSEAIKNNSEAQDILKRLIELGKDIQDNISNEEVVNSLTAEKELLRQDLDKNDLVKKHLTNQRLYLQLFKDIIQQIKNPQSEQK